MTTFPPEQQQALAALLDRHAAEGNTMRLDEVQGFVLALISGSDPINVGTWLPEIFADETLFDDAERDRVANLVGALASTTQAGLQQNRLPELFLYDDEDGKTDFYTWCNAYLYALDIAPTDWFAAVDDEEFEDLFYPIMALGGVYDENEEQTALFDIGDQERQTLQSELPHTLLAIYRYWQARLNKPTAFRRESSKPGRNKTCLCGSGRNS